MVSTRSGAGGSIKQRAVKANGANSGITVDMDIAGVAYPSHLTVHPDEDGHRKSGKQHGQAGGVDDAITLEELPNMALLVLLYAMQGIPLGLTSGAM
jgi:hypothetical protein